MVIGLVILFLFVVVIFDFQRSEILVGFLCTIQYLLKKKPDYFCSVEMLNHQRNAKRGFHPRRCGSPDAITPVQVLPHHRLSAGAAWGDRLMSPHSFVPVS